jgi:hypothetical protein
MTTVQDLMAELDGADGETVKRIVWENGPLLVPFATLGLTAIRKRRDSLWHGYPPGVFISYEWAGRTIRTRSR